MPKSPLAEHIIKVFSQQGASLFTDTPADIYAIGFLIEIFEQPALHIAANKESTARAAVAQASTPGEARWNYAFWEQYPLLEVFGDQAGADLMEKWFAQYDESTSEEEVINALAKIAVDAARELHADGTIERVFGRSIPIVFHDLEGRDQMFDWTREANPDGLAEEFINCRGGFA